MFATRRCLGLLLVILLFAIGPSVLGKSQPAVVTLKSGEQIKGDVLQLTAERVAIDPEGPRSYLLISAEQIDSVELPQQGKTLRFPITSSQVPSALASAKLTSGRPERGFRVFVLDLSAGAMTTGFSDDDRKYYTGFGGGLTFQGAFRFYIPEQDPLSSRVFFGVTYRSSSPGVQAEYQYIPIGYDSAYNTVYMESKPLRVYHLGFELGMTSRIVGNDSYFYFLVGYASLDNRITGRLSYGPGNEISDWVTVTDKHGALRLAGGGVIGITSRVGLSLNLGMDLMYSGTGENEYGQSVPRSSGGIFLADAGLNIEL